MCGIRDRDIPGRDKFFKPLQTRILRLTCYDANFNPLPFPREQKKADVATSPFSRFKNRDQLKR